MRNDDRISVEREIGALEARIDKLDLEVQAMRSDVREIRDALVTARGGWKMLTVVIGLSVSVGAMIGKVLPVLMIARP